MTPDPSPYRIRRDYRAEWARLDTPPWRRLARNLAGVVRAWAWRAVTW